MNFARLEIKLRTRKEKLTEVDDSCTGLISRVEDLFRNKHSVVTKKSYIGYNIILHYTCEMCFRARY